MELRVVEMEERVMARLDRGFKYLSRRMLALEQLVDEEWKEIVGRPDPEEPEEDTEMGEEARDRESGADEVAEKVAEDRMEE